MATKVLVFESDPSFAGELRNELGKLGCATTVVDDGNVGLQQATTDKPDLILLSIELPRMNGFSVCNKLKKDPNLKDVPLVIMSSESSDETFDQHKKLRTRAEDYVHKPIAFGELLQHIQVFVPLGVVAGGDDMAIVIEDEIEIGSTDYIPDEDGAPGEPDLPPARAAEKQAEKTIDADVDAFAESAFGRLQDDQEATAVKSRNGQPAAEVVSKPSTPPRKPSRAQSARPAPAPAPAGVALAEHEKTLEELARAKNRVGTAERELQDAQNEVEKFRLEAGEAERLAREVEELKTKLAAGAAKGGGISSREFLDLREALNKKDKEILALKEQLSKKDKEIVEAQDKTLAFERGKSDLDDRLLGLERQLEEAKEKSEALAADKDLAKKAADDFRTRAEKARSESEAKDKQIAELRSKHAEENASNEAKLSALRAEVDQTLANERAEHARALDQSEERRKADLQQAKGDREAALAEVRELADREKQEAVSTQAAQLKQESDGKMAALHRAHQQELDRAKTEVRAEAEKHEQSALETLRSEHSEKVSSLQNERDSRIALIESERDSRIASLESERDSRIASLENDRDSRIAAIESKAVRDLGEANDKLGKLDMDLSAARGELVSLRETKDDLEKRLAETTSARDDFDKKHASATDRLAALEAEMLALRQEFSETKQKLATETSRADKAQAKWESDRQSLERAKDALAVALSQIEEAEGRPI